MEAARQQDSVTAYVGILARRTKGAPPFGEAAYFRRLSIAGRRYGVPVYVFSLDGVDWRRSTVSGYEYDPEQAVWLRSIFPLPALIYDRAFFASGSQLRRHRAELTRLLAYPGVKLLGKGLPGKLEVYRMLSAHRHISAALPLTKRYSGPASLAAWLNTYGEAILKPHNGTHGKGVFRIAMTRANRFEALGRDRNNCRIIREFEHLFSLLSWVDRVLIANRPFVLQQSLQLTTVEDAPFDIRALVQKNGRGTWEFTGAAARIGPVGSLTSNLHGGGTAACARLLLAKEFGPEMADTLMGRLKKTALSIPSVLEQAHGPLLELGVDFGVDRQGNIWVLEVNSRPGRSSFTQLSDKSVWITAVTRPIRYARYLLNCQLGGQMNEFDVK